MHSRSLPKRRPWPLVSAVALAAWLAAGCGGGDGAGNIGSGGTGALSFSQGPISGFGSIVVNGVHFDDSAAIVLDEDGNALSNAASLRLGSTVDVEGGAVVSGAAAASTIRVRTDLVGPVTRAFDATTGLIHVLGLPVNVNATTALDGFAGGAAGVAVGAVVAVSSLYNPAAAGWVATRIDPAPAAARFAVRGAVASSSGGGFAIGGQTFDLNGVATPAGFGPGRIVRVELLTVPGASGRYAVSAFGDGVAPPGNGREGELRGVVAAVADAGHFAIGGLAVDASRAAVTPAGAVVAAKSLVEVHGGMVQGVLVATRIDVVAGDDDGGSGGGGGGSAGGDQFEIHGEILGAVDAAHQTFTMRGPTTVGYAGATFSGGAAATLARGARIEVKGNLSADGTQVIATRIKFDD
ncbi:MAG: DUF5666 domain-containing protein [Burkholderiaceae bacterium]